MSAPVASPPSRSGRMLAMAGLLLATLLNLQHLAWWCLPLLGGAALWHARSALRGTPLPGRPLRLLLTALLTAGVLVSFRGFGGFEAAATLLAAMTAAKLFEARTTRDWYVLLAATIFLLLAACLDRQQMLRLPAYALSLWLCAAALRGMDSHWQPPLRVLLFGAGRQLLLAVPLAAVLFLFFPRLPGGFWALPSAEQAITGLSDEMTPGAISQLAESDEPTLRVRFNGPLPPPGERYWRGPVLHDFDGETWRRRRGPLGRQPPLDYRGPEYRYSMTVEPGALPVVPAMQFAQPLRLPFVLFSDDFQIVLPRALDQPRTFELSSFPAAQSPDELQPYVRRVDLALPAGRNPRSLALARQLRAGAADDPAFVRATLEYLHTGGFVYTLQPQRLGRNSIDDLLFGTHEGFCGHYASAFVTLMRAGGVPARVITGYLGGLWNPIGGYLQVRAAEAHAWAEVWLPGRGWTRADPTAVIAPERLTRGEYEFSLGASGNVVRRLQHAPWLSQALLAWAATNAWWQDKVIGFNFARQLDFTRWLGLGDADWQVLALLLGAGLLAWIIWLSWSLRSVLPAPRADAAARGWRLIERRLARAGLPRPAQEGILDFSLRVAASRTALAATLLPLARQYLALRYGPPPAVAGAAAGAQFLRAARAFRIPGPEAA
jgi:transglutaminase-like putative cysteine protease